MGYPCPDGDDDPPPANSAPKSGTDPARPWRPSSGTPDPNYTPTPNEGAVASRAPVLSVDRIVAMPSSYRVPSPLSAAQQKVASRPEVQSAMRALREMPPFAREREIETGRYSHFPPDERELLRSME